MFSILTWFFPPSVSAQERARSRAWQALLDRYARARANTDEYARKVAQLERTLKAAPNERLAALVPKFQAVLKLHEDNLAEARRLLASHGLWTAQ